MKHYLESLGQTMKANWERPALCNYKADQFTHAEVANIITKFGIAFEDAGFKKGDKISLCAKNTARWAVSYLSIAAYETVLVSILCDFHPDSVTKLVAHSGSKFLFTDRDIWEKLDKEKMPELLGAINVDDFSLLWTSDEKVRKAFEGADAKFAKKYPSGVSKEEFCFRTDNLSDLNVINYTSGTTSDPKGVMLTYGNISASVDFGIRHEPIYEGEAIVSMLPMAHIYGMVFEFLYPLSGGATVYYLGKSPAPSLLLKAMQDVHPYLICTVPLVMEKIFKSAVKPIVSKWYMKVACAIPGLNKVIFNTIRKKLDAAFGGHVREYIMGGAALNPEVEKWFRRIGLHYLVGYGMTEASPLLAYESWDKYEPGSCGKSVDCAVVRIDSEDPANIVGEIQAKGDNITIGYYNNPEATANAFTDDGFLHTGDLGVIDAQGNIFIKGRSKNMILSANGQNIYPEEIEAIVNQQDWVVESVVVDRNGKIVAIVYLDADGMKKAGLSEEDIADVPSKVRAAANRALPGYSKIAVVEVVSVPFEKTPKMSIKRFLYK